MRSGYPRSIARLLVLPRAAVGPSWPRPLWLVLVCLVITLPFAAIRPLLVTPWGALTDDRLLMSIAALAWFAFGGRPTRAEWRTLTPTLVFFAVCAVSAALAETFQVDALKSLWRLAAAGLVMLLALRTSTTETTDQRPLVWAVIVGAGLSALLGLAEAVAGQQVEPILAPFKVAPTRVGGDLRVSGSFQYATIAAMYYEMATPLAVALAAATTRTWRRVLATLIAALCTLNIVLSLTRSASLTLALICGLLLLLASTRPKWRSLTPPTLATAAVLLGSTVWLAVSDPVFNLRLVSENDADWYGAAYVAPPALTLEPNHVVTIGLDVHNAGRITWSSADRQHPFALSYRWLTGDGNNSLDLPAGEVSLPRDVAPGETLHLEPDIPVPNLPPGTYRLDWGMLQRDVVQFYERGWATAQTVVTISTVVPGAQTPRISPRDDGQAPWVVPRLDLWGAAIHLIQLRPVLGVGPDNFRHLYGAELGLDSWDERVQANNLYLEILVDTGIFGLAAFAWIVSRPLRAAAGRCGAAKPDYLALGATLGVLAFLVHGLLDVFIAFTPTLLLFWLLLGVLSTQKPQVSGR